jgi:hypothetical protein
MDNVWVESRIRDEDQHILIGYRSDRGQKSHIIIDGKTGEIRVENNQKLPEDLVSRVETILTLPDGRKIRTSRELLEAEFKKADETVDGFAAHILQTGGVGSHHITKRAWLLTEHAYLDVDEYVKTAFNGPGDVMWIVPKEGYKVTTCSSPTGNRLHIDREANACNILIEDKLKNEVLLECTRL